MLWLIDQVWPWMIASALAGAVLTGLFSIKRVSVRRWVEGPVDLDMPDAADLDDVEVEPEPDPEPVVDPAPVSPFPPLADGGRPWEQEETWSGPERRSRVRRPADEWDVAAQHWREWAQATAGAAPEERPSPVEGTSASSPESAPAATPDPVVDPLPVPAAHDEFPHAVPVEAVRVPVVPEPDPAEYARRVAARLEAERLEAERSE